MNKAENINPAQESYSGAGDTTEIVREDGSSKKGFNLKYDRGYKQQTYFVNMYINIFGRYACAIPDVEKQEVIITGGSATQTRVSVYSEDGWQRDLASMREERIAHACSSFVNGGKTVNSQLASAQIKPCQTPRHLIIYSP